MKRFLVSIAALLLVSTVGFGETLSGTILDSNGRPVEGAFVLVSQSTSIGGQPSSLCYRTTSNTDGSFSFDNVKSGTVKIHAAKRLTGNLTETIEVTSGKTAQIEMRLSDCLGGYSRWGGRGWRNRAAWGAGNCWRR